MRYFIRVIALCTCGLLSTGIGQASATPREPAVFTMAVVSDTQNMLDYRHQRSEGFVLDGADQFLTMMRAIAAWRDDNDRPLAFVAGVGDVSQHQSLAMDPAHAARGFEAIENPYINAELGVTQRVITDEMPVARKGYALLRAAGIPFGVAPGNHDYDAKWSVPQYPPRLDLAPEDVRIVPEHIGMLHVGGLDNFRAVFSGAGDMYRNAPWYVGSYDGGSNSAQLFRAGGYEFLHLALEMQPGDAVLAWAQDMLARFQGRPTIVSTHDYLSTRGERLPVRILDLAHIDPEEHNSAQQLWDKFISRNDQIFLVLCGHQHGQGRAVEPNRAGNEVIQLLADYQSRGQSALDAGAELDPRRQRPPGVGDGWFRLLTFDFSAQQAKLRVRTYSSHYNRYASELESYAQWYGPYEQPELSAEAFLDRDEFDLELRDFQRRFGPPEAL
jgi:hypothetical protein